MKRAKPRARSLGPSVSSLGAALGGAEVGPRNEIRDDVASRARCEAAVMVDASRGSVRAHGPPNALDA